MRLQTAIFIKCGSIVISEPAGAVERYLRREGDVLHAGERTYDLARYEQVFLVGAGKAGAPMARAAAEVLGDRLAGGVVVVKEGYAEESRRPEDRQTGGVASPSLVSWSPGLGV